MLYYAGKSDYAYQSVKADKVKPILKNNWWFKWLRMTIQTISSILLSIATRAIDAVVPGLGLALEFALDTLIDLLFNWLENDGKIDWTDFSITAGFNAAGAIVKGFKLFKAARVQNKVLSLADNILDSNKKFKKQFKNTAKELTKFGARKSSEVITTNYESIKESALAVEKKLNNKIFKETAKSSKVVFDKTKKVLDKTTKVFTKIRTFVSLLTSPRYAAKKAVDTLIKKPRREIVKKFNKFATEKVKKIIFKGKKTLEESMKRIPLASSWLDTITILRSNNVWDFKNVNAIIRFKKQETHNKKPVILWQKDKKLILEFLTTSSPGEHYLKYFAWGWDIGKILRNFNGFIALSKIPLFSNLISTIAHSYKTINAIAKSIKKDKWLWNQDEKDFSSDILSGAKEGALKGWNFKYIRPLVSFTRSAIEHSPTYGIRAASVGVRKAIFYSSFSKPIKNYSYKKMKGARKWKK